MELLELFVAYALNKALIGALIIAVIVVWLCKKKIIKKDKTKTALSVGLVALALTVCFGMPIYSIEKTKDIPYQTVSCNRYDIVKLENGNTFKGTQIKAVVQDESGKTKNISFYPDRFDIGNHPGKQHTQILKETTGTSYIEEKVMEKKNSLMLNHYQQIVIHLSKEDKEKIK